MLAPRLNLATRLDLPLFLTDAVSPNNPGGASLLGVGDMLLQGLLIYAPTQRFAVVGGTQMIFPTASRDNMGAGKYRLVPTLGARYNLPEITKGSWAAFLLRYDYDVAGESDRRHISELQLAPLVNIALPDGWFEAEADGGPGAEYMYRLPSGQAVPDPASRAQADDVHGPSVVVDPGAYRWRHPEWSRRSPHRRRTTWPAPARRRRAAPA